MIKGSENSGNRLLITLQEAAEMLSMHRHTVMNHVYRGSLPCVRLARNAVYFRPGDLNEFIQKHLVRYNPTEIPRI